MDRVLGVRPEPVQLFLEAFTHPSFSHEQPEPRPAHNQRLEFLGDAVVGLVVASELFQRHPDRSEGELTRRRAAVVNTRALAEAARRMGLNAWLRLGKGEELAGGRERDSNLSALYEAVAGAVFSVAGFDAAREFVLRGLKDRLDSFAQASPDLAAGFDAKTRLQEYLQALEKVAPEYRVVEVSGPDHARTFTVAVSWRGRELAVGKGASKKAAEQDAALRALNLLAQEASDGGPRAPGD
ncbi:MAG: ribonuclease III [Firmicutes bacterium]|nr:ribonuclease III [Bacillota bacterium]